MEVRHWQATGSMPPMPPTLPTPPVPPPPTPPGPPPPPAFPPPPPSPYGYVVPFQVAAPVRHLLPPPAAQPARRSPLLGWLGAAVATLLVAVPALMAQPHRGVSATTGLHAVTGVSSGPWTAEFVDASGLPARWDPCMPIHYVVNYAYAQAGAATEVRQAIDRISAASGLTFVPGEDTLERPTRDRSSYQPSVYGSGWAPVLISWSPPGLTDLLGDPKAEAVTVPVAVASAAGTGGGSLVSAEIVLNTGRQLKVGFGPGLSEGEVLMHELGHAVGLGHVSSIGEAMYPSVRGIAAYGSGDLAGLAALGRPAGCHAAPAAHPLRVQPSSLG